MSVGEKILANVEKHGDCVTVDLTLGTAHLVVKWDVTDVDPMTCLVCDLSEYVTKAIEALLQEMSNE